MHLPSPDGDQIHNATLFSGPVEFVKGSVSLTSLPPADRIEVAFAGRSNVGKSSLINGLVNRKNLARASNEPGRTRELNFFNLGNHIRFADLPGFGYARASKTAIKQWSNLNWDYLRGRVSLRRVFFLIDSRRKVMDIDCEAMTLLDEAATSYQIILTKIDKLKPNEFRRVLENTHTAISKRPAAHPNILACSTVKHIGLNAIRAEIDRLMT